MKQSELKESKYLKQHDVGTGVLLTMKELRHENMSMEGQEKDMKWVLYFNECDKGMVLNDTNITSIMTACRTDDTDNWFGNQIVLFTDPNVMYMGKVTGGVRCRAPKQQSARPAPAPAPVLSQVAPAAIRAAAAAAQPPVPDDDNCPF